MKKKFQTNLSVIGLSRAPRCAKMPNMVKNWKKGQFSTFFKNSNNMWIVTPFCTKVPNLGVLGSKMWILGPKNWFLGLRKYWISQIEIFSFFSFSISSVSFCARDLIFVLTDAQNKYSDYNRSGILIFTFRARLRIFYPILGQNRVTKIKKWGRKVKIKIPPLL